MSTDLSLTLEGTLVIDHVEFVPRLRWISGGSVQRDVSRIFEFRRETLVELLPHDKVRATTQSSSGDCS